MTQPTLYRMYDFVGCLLYVGRTINPRDRLRDHQRGKDWWDRIAMMTLEPFDSELELMSAEAEAIRTEHPIFNVVGDSTRHRIAKIGLQIDQLYGNRPGACLQGLYFWHWPPEMCTPHDFEEVYEQCQRDLTVAKLIAGGVPRDEAIKAYER